MSCPKCGGFVYYNGEPLAVEILSNGGWIYYDAECEDCDWAGIGRWWFDLNFEYNYEDGVELPTPGKGVFLDDFFKKEVKKNPAAKKAPTKKRTPRRR